MDYELIKPLVRRALMAGFWVGRGWPIDAAYLAVDNPAHDNGLSDAQYDAMSELVGQVLFNEGMVALPEGAVPDPPAPVAEGADAPEPPSLAAPIDLPPIAEV